MKCNICGEYVDRRTKLIGGLNVVLCEKHLTAFEDYRWEYHTNEMCDLKNALDLHDVIRQKAYRGLAKPVDILNCRDDIHEAEAEFRVITKTWMAGAIESEDESNAIAKME